jgi:hypothetical protein
LMRNMRQRCSAGSAGSAGLWGTTDCLRDMPLAIAGCDAGATVVET